jgi:hypothetical protein
VNYRHRLKITRPGTGTQDASGGWTAGPETVVLDVAADVQDHGPGIRRSAAGEVFDESDALAFLPRGTDVGGIKPEDPARITWPDGTTQQAQVVRARRLDQTVSLKFV